MTFAGVVEKLETDDVGCAWAHVAVTLRVGEKTVTECATRIALPSHEGDNPWRRAEERWKP